MAELLFSRLNLAQPRTATYVWPINPATQLPAESLCLSLDDAEWNQVGTEIEVRSDLSWDGGATFPVFSADVMVMGAKDRAGNPPWSCVGPFHLYVGRVTEAPRTLEEFPYADLGFLRPYDRLVSATLKDETTVTLVWEQAIPNPPTHVRTTLRKVAGNGNPKIGLWVGFDGDRARTDGGELRTRG